MRPALHAAAGLGALTLRFLDPAPAAAFAALLVVHNLLLFPRYASRVMRPPGPRADAGVVSYPLVVLAVVIVFASRPDFAAAAWAILAFGDAAAAWIGARVRGPRVPWNAGKHLSGSLAFVAVGAAAAVAVAAFVAAAPGQWLARLSPADVIAVVVAAIAAAVAESLEGRLVDNVRIGVALVAVLGAAALMDGPHAHAALHQARVALPSAVVLAVTSAGLAFASGAFSRSGAAAGALLAAVVFASGGPAAFATLAAFVAPASVATRIGRRRKEARGVAQPRGGRRGASHVWANGALAGALAISAAASGAAPGLQLAFVGALATAAFDTVATEIGQAFAGRALLFPSGRPVAPGTPGAVSWPGSLAGGLAAMLVAVVAAAGGAVPWRAVPWLGLAAATGAFLESAAAANPGIRQHLGGHARNFLNTAAGAAAAALFAAHTL